MEGSNQAQRYTHCIIPGCGRKALIIDIRMVSRGLYVCGICMMELRKQSEETSGDADRWRECLCGVRRWSEEICKQDELGDTKGHSVSSPDTLAFQSDAKCAMPWCSFRTAVHLFRSHGPNGEPLCDTDENYLYFQGKARNKSTDEMFLEAVAGRLSAPKHVHNRRAGLFEEEAKVKCSAWWCKEERHPADFIHAPGNLPFCREDYNHVRRHVGKHDNVSLEEAAKKATVPSEMTARKARGPYKMKPEQKRELKTCQAWWCGKQLKAVDLRKFLNTTLLCPSDYEYLEAYAWKNGILPETAAWQVTEKRFGITEPARRTACRKPEQMNQMGECTAWWCHKKEPVRKLRGPIPTPVCSGHYTYLKKYADEVGKPFADVVKEAQTEQGGIPAPKKNSAYGKTKKERNRKKKCSVWWCDEHLPEKKLIHIDGRIPVCRKDHTYITKQAKKRGSSLAATVNLALDKDGGIPAPAGRLTDDQPA